MDDVSGRRSIFGRLLTALGFVWLFWSLFGDLVTLEFGTTPIDVPILPGFVFLFLGRALSRGARRGAARSEEVEPSPPRTERQARLPLPPNESPAPSPVELRPVPSPTPLEEMEVAVEDPVVIEEDIVEAMETDLDPAPESIGVRKTSAEMVAEARRRFGRRPD